MPVDVFTMQHDHQLQIKKPLTTLELTEKTAQLMASVKSLQAKYDEFMADKEIGDDSSKLMEHQNKCWDENVGAIFIEIGQNATDVEMRGRCRLVWDHCFLTHFYNEKILCDWSPIDLELRKLIILLGIHNLKKFIKGNPDEKPVDVTPNTSGEEADNKASEQSDSPENQPDSQDTTTIDLEPHDNDDVINAEIHAEDADNEASEQSDSPQYQVDFQGTMTIDIEPHDNVEVMNAEIHAEINVAENSAEEYWLSTSDDESEREMHFTNIQLFTEQYNQW